MDRCDGDVEGVGRGTSRRSASANVSTSVVCSKSGTFAIASNRSAAAFGSPA